VNNSQFSPKIFTLSAGMHQLIVRGREPNTQLSTITVTPAYAKLQISALPGQGMLLSGVARIGQTYELQATQDLQTWTVIQTLTTDNRGEFAFIDTAALSLPARCYRLRETAP
jgi:hypothetical protein